MELLDAYDYDGNKKGYTVERGCGKENDWFLCVHAYVVNQEGKFLIQRRALTKEYFPGIWDITCGAALSGETAEEAAIREVKEELGLDVSSFKRYYVCKSHCYDCLNYVYFFVGSFSLNDLVLQKDEVMDVKLVCKEELLDLILNSEFKDDEYFYNISSFLNNYKKD